MKDLSEWMDLGPRGDRYIEIDELEPLKQRIGAFLLAKNPVTVDGEALKPILDRTNYVKVGLSGLRILEIPERLEVDAAIVGVIITCRTAARWRSSRLAAPRPRSRKWRWKRHVPSGSTATA